MVLNDLMNRVMNSKWQQTIKLSQQPEHIKEFLIKTHDMHGMSAGKHHYSVINIVMLINVQV